RGRVFGFKGDYDRAIKDYNEAILLDPNMVIAYNNRGDAYLRKGDYARAIADFNEAVRIDPNYPQAYDNRAYAWYAQKQFDRAIADYTGSLALRPDPMTYLRRGNVYRDIDDLDRAGADYGKVIALIPGDARGWRNRALIRLFKGDNAGGIADYNKALKLDP